MVHVLEVIIKALLVLASNNFEMYVAVSWNYTEPTTTDGSLKAMWKRFINSGFIPGVKDSTFYSTFQLCHENIELKARIHYDTSPMPKARGSPKIAQSFAVMASLCARVQKKSLQKSPNESQAVDWRPDPTALDWSIPTRCKSKKPQVGTAKKACRDHPSQTHTHTASGILLETPWVKDQETECLK